MSHRRLHLSFPVCRRLGRQLRASIAVGLLGMTTALASCATERPFVWIQDLPAAAAGEADGTVRPRDSIAVVVMDQPTMSGEFVVHDDGSYLQPTLGNVMEDLLTYGEGLEVAERDLLVNEVGKQPQALPDQVIAVVRDGVVHRYFDPSVTQLVRGDRLVVVRPAEELPWAPRPGTHGETLSGEEE